MNIYRYSVNCGEAGGAVIAGSLYSAREKVEKKYPGRTNDINVWHFIFDDHYDDDNPEVIECYGLGVKEVAV